MNLFSKNVIKKKNSFDWVQQLYWCGVRGHSCLYPETQPHGGKAARAILGLILTEEKLLHQHLYPATYLSRFNQADITLISHPWEYLLFSEWQHLEIHSISGLRGRCRTGVYWLQWGQRHRQGSGKCYDGTVGSSFVSSCTMIKRLSCQLQGMISIWSWAWTEGKTSVVFISWDGFNLKVRGCNTMRVAQFIETRDSYFSQQLQLWLHFQIKKKNLEFTTWPSDGGSV